MLKQTLLNIIFVYFGICYLEIYSRILDHLLKYSNSKNDFTPDHLKSLFASVHYAEKLKPDELFEAILASTHVVAAWDGSLLVGFIRSMDDTIYCANIDLLLVRPDYQKRGIARELIRRLLLDIETIQCISVSPSESKNNRLYTGFGFQIVEGAGLLQKDNSK